MSEFIAEQKLRPQICPEKIALLVSSFRNFRSCDLAPSCDVPSESYPGAFLTTFYPHFLSLGLSLSDDPTFFCISLCFINPETRNLLSRDEANLRLGK